MTIQIKSKKRIAEHGEVFTNEREVNAMLDMVKTETDRIDSRFLEPACGTGNFLIEILSRKLKVVESNYKKNKVEYERYSIIALSSIYGIDLLEDNTQQTRKRLLDKFEANYFKLYKKNINEEYVKAADFILSKNIIQGDALTLRHPETHSPIVFCEWSAINDVKIKRRDFTLDELLQQSPFDGPSLFSDCGDDVFIPKPIKEFKAIHYLNLKEQENGK